MRRSFFNEKKLEFHQKVIHSVIKKENYPCTICLKTFTHKNNLIRHKKSHINSEKLEKCIECGKWIKSLKSHQSDVHKKEKECHICKKFFSEKRLKQHKKTCSSEFTCSVCSRVCGNKSGLSRHMKNHESSSKN